MTADRFAASGLEALLEAGFVAGGFLPDTARRVARHLVDAELKGVSSHGVNRLGWYLDRVTQGALDPRATPTVADVEGGLLRVDGGGGIGIPAMELALERVLARAATAGIAAAGIVNVGHTGRIGAYVGSAAHQGFFAQCLGGGGRRKWPNVVPFGGLRPVMSTNPYAFGIPGGGDASVVCDFAISAVAGGKIALARAKGEALPDGLLLDKEGRPTTRPEDYDEGGALLPAAGPKGSGMGLVAELVGDAMLGEPLEFNWLMIAIKADAFRPMADYLASARALTEEVHAIPPAQGFTSVSLPGEPEAKLAAERRANGIPLAPAVWDGIVKAARGVGVDPDAFPVRAA